jgi:hypothetical protein
MTQSDAAIQLTCTWCGQSVSVVDAHSGHRCDLTPTIARVARIERILRAACMHEPTCSNKPCDCWLAKEAT